MATHTDTPGSTGANSDSPFLQLAEHCIATQQAQLNVVRQLVQQYRNAQDLDELIALQTEVLGILDRQDEAGHACITNDPAQDSTCEYISTSTSIGISTSYTTAYGCLYGTSRSAS